MGNLQRGQQRPAGVAARLAGRPRDFDVLSEILAGAQADGHRQQLDELGGRAPRALDRLTQRRAVGEHAQREVLRQLHRVGLVKQVDCGHVATFLGAQFERRVTCRRLARSAWTGDDKVRSAGERNGHPFDVVAAADHLIGGNWRVGREQLATRPPLITHT